MTDSIFLKNIYISQSFKFGIVVLTSKFNKLTRIIIHANQCTLGNKIAEVVVLKITKYQL